MFRFENNSLILREKYKNQLDELRSSLPEFDVIGSSIVEKPCCCTHAAIDFLNKDAVPFRWYDNYIVFRAQTADKILDMCFEHPGDDIFDGFVVDEDTISEMNYWIKRIELFGMDGTICAVTLSERFPIDCEDDDFPFYPFG